MLAYIVKSFAILYILYILLTFCLFFKFSFCLFFGHGDLGDE